MVEVLIVIVILSILAAIVVFAVQNLSKSTASAACTADYKTVESAVEAYKAQMGNYPSGSNGGAPSAKPFTDSGAPGDNAAGAGGELLVSGATAPNSGTDGIVGPWLKEVPGNPGHYTLTVANDGSGSITVILPGDVTSTCTSAT